MKNQLKNICSWFLSELNSTKQELATTNETLSNVIDILAS